MNQKLTREGSPQLKSQRPLVHGKTFTAATLFRDIGILEVERRRQSIFNIIQFHSLQKLQMIFLNNDPDTMTFKYPVGIVYFIGVVELIRIAGTA